MAGIFPSGQTIRLCLKGKLDQIESFKKREEKKKWNEVIERMSNVLFVEGVFWKMYFFFFFFIDVI